jgi:Dienelactone hydrolase family
MTGVRTWTICCGGGMPAFLAAPDDAAKAPAVIVVHERYGLVRHTCDLAERFARDGFVAIAPDLYFNHPDQHALHRGDAGCDISDPDALIALRSAIGALNAVPQVDLSRLAIMGICQTGRLHSWSRHPTRSLRRSSGTARPSRANGRSTASTLALSMRSLPLSTVRCSACSARPII